jgi:hypothetical protein
MLNRSLSRRSFATLALTAMVGRAAFSASLSAPREKPILTISGLIGVRNSDGGATFDRGMLEALGTRSFRTTTPWYTGVVEFEGVPMRRLLQAVEASGTRVVATALNDYTTEIPTSDFEQYDVLLALKRDGAYMPVRDKGPLFIIYPFDTDRHLQSQTYYGRCAWQVRELVVS